MTVQTSGYRILVVEDDEVDRQYYRTVLARRAPGACEFQPSPDGEAGLAALRAFRPDCVLLDFHLPDMTGLEFLTRAAVDGALPCAFVLITGQGNEAIAVEAMHRGAQDYLVKGEIDGEKMWRAIVGAVSRCELQQKLAGTLRDLTAANAALEQEIVIRRNAEADMHAANQAKTRFIATVTHELRTPLNGVLGYAQLLRIEGGLTARQDKHVTAMIGAGRHLFDMIEGVLDFASIETGQIELHTEWIAVRDIAESCVACVESNATAKRLQLHLIAADTAPRTVIADPVRLRQVILNLLGNAVKFTASGHVELRVLRGDAPGGLRIEVADSGAVIPVAVRDRLFQEFERLDAAASIEGAGMGLVISARIVGLMGGRIGYSANPAGGNVFWIELPVRNAAQREAATRDIAQPEIAREDIAEAQMAPPLPPKTATLTPPGAIVRVLLVDDIAMNRDIIGAFLRAEGHHVILAESGQEAIQAASEQIPDVVLMDIRMPEMDGLEATRRIRALPAPFGQVPIVALTAYSFPEQVTQCRIAGMNGHVGKPVDYAVLMRAVADAVARKPVTWSFDRPAAPPAEAAPIPALKFDRGMLDEMLTMLSPDEATRNLHMLRARLGEVLQLIDRPATPDILTDAAHGLGASAGTFGFAALSVAARDAVRAMAFDSGDTDGATARLRVEILAAQAALDKLIRERRMAPV